MDADFSVELGAEDPILDFPWEAPGTALRYYDVKAAPDQLRFIDEAEKYHELRDFLASVNSPTSMFETAKCDVWTDDDLTEIEDIYDAQLKFVSYVDLVFAGQDSNRTNFDAHERGVRRLVELLGRAPQISSAAEFIIRRCYFHQGSTEESGFYITFYLSGYGADEGDARRHWGIGLNVVKNALLQISAEIRR
jgi:hypothetical protein